MFRNPVEYDHPCTDFWSASFLPPLLSPLHRDPLAYVNPLIGTQKSRIGYGGTMPFVSPPFAMTNWTPQTRQNKISITSYEYDDKAISGFIGTHQPAIWMGDYGYITLMPQVGELRTTPEGRQLGFLPQRRNRQTGLLCRVRCASRKAPASAPK